jgi:hypothetical protein
MALNSSGPISLGGATTGQSVNLELGNAATAVASINSTPFRTLAGVPSGAIALSNFYGKSNTQGFYFFYFDNSATSLNNTATGNYRGINKDSSGNIRMASYMSSSADGSGVYLTKITSSATAPSVTSGQTYHPETTMSGFVKVSGLDNATPTGSILDSSDNLYVATQQTGNTPGGGRPYSAIGGIMKFDSSGAYLAGVNWWYMFNIEYGTVRTYSIPSNGSLSIDSSSNLYTSLYSYQLWVDGYYGCYCCVSYGSSFFPAVVKISNTPGVVSYNRLDWSSPVVTGASPYSNYYYRPNSVTSSAGNTYVAGSVQGGGNSYQTVIKLNSSMAITARVAFSPSGSVWTQQYGSENGAMQVDSSENVYIGEASTGLGVLKVNSSLAYQWAFRYALPANYSSVSFQGLILDSSSNIYLCGMSTNNTTTFQETILLKLNSSGVLQWARRIANENYHIRRPSMVLISDTTIGLSMGAPNGQQNNNMPMLYMQYPTSGSYTGLKTVVLATPSYSYSMNIASVSITTTSVGSATTVTSAATSSSVSPNSTGGYTPAKWPATYTATTATGAF